MTTNVVSRTTPLLAGLALVGGLMGSLLSGEAQAGTQTLGVVGPAVQSTIFSNPNGTFFDSLNFSVASAANLYVTVSDLELTQTVGQTATIVLDNVNLVGNLYNNSHPNGTEGFGSLGSFSQTFSFLLPHAGDFHLDFSGSAVGTNGGLYGVALSASPVPEPGALSLMLAGLGALGFMARRRSH